MQIHMVPLPPSCSAPFFFPPRFFPSPPPPPPWFPFPLSPRWLRFTDAITRVVKKFSPASLSFSPLLPLFPFPFEDGGDEKKRKRVGCFWFSFFFHLFPPCPVNLPFSPHPQPGYQAREGKIGRLLLISPPVFLPPSVRARIVPFCTLFFLFFLPSHYGLHIVTLSNM